MNELTRHPTSNNILRDSAVAKSTSNHGQYRTQSFAAGDNEMLRKLGEMLIGSLDGQKKFVFDPLALRAEHLD